ncbi:integrin beta-1-like [Sycon ciliatum]|uniref:integrin beta-1-like n=1 Tax=Sycon ciliatum TaxID=27933 RepID=UPI0031F63EE3
MSSSEMSSRNGRGSMAWWRRCWCLLYLLLSTLEYTCLRGVNCADIPGYSPSCSGVKTCSECLDLHQSCMWCADEAEEWRQRSRCLPVSEATRVMCHAPINPRSSINVLQDESFNVSQVKPQRVAVNLRSGSSLTLTVELLPNRNYELDVYYLMDHSFSMSDDLANMKRFATSIARSLQNLTSQYQLGYGTYVDKIIAPIVTTGRDAFTPLIPCAGCKYPYLFQNSLPLTNNATLFQETVSADHIAGNADIPEGTLDAIVQVAVCKKEVGWRQNSRRVLLVATDATTHTAGAGKRFGIHTPNSGKCHLDKHGVYLGRDSDYPSIAYMRYVLERENILPIFMTVDSQKPWFSSVVNEMQSAGAKLAKLSKSSDNVLEILETELLRLVRTGRMLVQQQAGINITVSAHCPDGGNASTAGSVEYCTNLDFGKKASFNVTLTALSCEDLIKTKQVLLRLVGYGDVIVDINALCKCPCEQNKDNSSDFCSGQGVSECGICKCNQGFRNKQANVSNCDCDIFSNSTCIANGTSSVCSDRGECVCQECVCGKPAGTAIPDAAYSGQYCECDNFNCPLSDTGAICGGTSQGSCVCGQCQCNANYTGSSCDCLLHSGPCKETSESAVCSEAGTCHCGACQCKDGFTGPYCEDCADTRSPCELAVICFNSTDGGSLGEALPSCPGLSPEQSTEDNPTIIGKRAYQCVSPVPIQATPTCTVSEFFAAFDTSKGDRCHRPFLPFVTKECTVAKPTSYLVIAVAPAGSLVLVALVTIIIVKLCVMHRDRLEYKTFIRETNKIKNNGMAENPLYKAATVKVVNPVFFGSADPDTKPAESN